MATSTETFSAGVPVEIGKIDRELKKLWAETSGAMARASLINLAVYSEEPHSLQKNTELVSRITENHACRAIVISANRAATENRVEAWISAHCHVTRSGSKQTCSEQLSFLLEGPCTKLLANIVFSQLDSDLPFHLWWQGEFHDPMDPQLFAWVDRLIYDSRIWNDFDAQMRRVETAQADAKQRVVLCDLNWTRLVQFRLALAQFFDHPASHRHFDEIKSVEIDFAPAYRSTAVLLAGWLSAQLHWAGQKSGKQNLLTFRSQSNKAIAVTLNEKAGEPISRCVLNCGPLEYRAAHLENADLLEISAGTRGEDQIPQLMPAGSNDPVRLMSEELMRGGPHRVYLRALNCVRAFL